MGHSTDGTLKSLDEFKKQEDVDNKLKIITKNGFWSEKDEQSQAYAEIATGDYLWQVDIDEFYRKKDIVKILELLTSESPDAVTFKQIAFWGSPNYVTSSFSQISDKCDQYHRLFKWGKGYSYVSHRPPTVLDQNKQNLRDKYWIKGDDLAKSNIFLFHYSLLFPLQVINKCKYYSTLSNHTKKGYSEKAIKWANECYFSLSNPFRVHNVYENISWLQRFDQEHPKYASDMWIDACNLELGVQIRNNSDIEILLSTTYYPFAAKFLNSLSTLLSLQPFHLFRKIYIPANHLFIKILNA